MTLAKAKVEVGVQVVQRWIVAALRKRKFFSLEEVNQAVAELLTRLNQRRFRKLEGSRAALFAQLDRPALKPLPATRYEFSEWSRCLGSSCLPAIHGVSRSRRLDATSCQSPNAC